MNVNDRVKLSEEQIVLSARAKLQKYYRNESHYRYHKGVQGIAYTIPISDVDGDITKCILILLNCRKCLLGIKGNNYVLYQNSNEDILTFSEDLVHSSSGLKAEVENMWNIFFKSSKKFFITFSLNRYFDEEGISDVLDMFMRSDERVVLSMMYNKNLTIMVLKDWFLKKSKEDSDLQEMYPSFH